MNQSPISPTPWRMEKSLADNGTMDVIDVTDDYVASYVKPNDAHLIAAAPDLLKAAEYAIKAQIQMCEKCFYFNEKALCVNAEKCGTGISSRRLKDAVAKAKGGTA